MSIATPSRATNSAGSTQTFAGLSPYSAQQVRDFLRQPGRLLIDGARVEAASGKTFEVREMGHSALENYLETKSVVTQLA